MVHIRRHWLLHLKQHACLAQWALTRPLPPPRRVPAAMPGHGPLSGERRRRILARVVRQVLTLLHLALPPPIVVPVVGLGRTHQCQQQHFAIHAPVALSQPIMDQQNVSLVLRIASYVPLRTAAVYAVWVSPRQIALPLRQGHHQVSAPRH